MKFVDLFCGIGGFRIALESLGHECVFSCDTDKYARQTYKANFNDEPAGDIKQIDTNDIPRHDILTGGFPCQSFSVAGRRWKRVRDKNLVFEIIRVADHHKPRIMLMENVLGLMVGKMKPMFDLILNELRGLGYKVYVDKLNASDYGIPQKRTRIYFVCLRNDTGLVYRSPILIDYERKTLTDVLQPEGGVDEKYFLTDGLKRMHMKHHDRHGGKFGYRIYTRNDTAPTLLKRYDKDGARSMLIGEKHDDGKPLINKRVRKLTPREALRLMGFPDTFKIPVSDTQLYKQAGNAVIPKMIEVVFNGIGKQ